MKLPAKELQSVKLFLSVMPALALTLLLWGVTAFKAHRETLSGTAGGILFVTAIQALLARRLEKRLRQTT